MLLRACRNFERFFELVEGEAFEQWIDEHSLNVSGWAEAHVNELEEIQRRKDQRESNSLIGSCSMVANDQSLFPLMRRHLRD